MLGRDVRTDKDVTRNIAYVFQNARLLPWRTLRQNAEFGLRGLQAQPKARWPALIEHYFGVVGLTDFVNYYPHQVSGGMQQRASIVRAFVNEPRILLMDEPFSHLDELTAADLRTELVRLWSQDEDRRTIVFVTHDINEAVTLGERIVMMTMRPSTICYDASVELTYPASRPTMPSSGSRRSCATCSRSAPRDAHERRGRQPRRGRPRRAAVVRRLASDWDGCAIR